jgi:hypothetical protein
LEAWKARQGQALQLRRHSSCKSYVVEETWRGIGGTACSKSNLAKAQRSLIDLARRKNMSEVSESAMLKLG